MTAGGALKGRGLARVSGPSGPKVGDGVSVGVGLIVGVGVFVVADVAVLVGAAVVGGIELGKEEGRFP